MRLDLNRRWVIGGSQLHMTANRLGVSNPEEVYLSRLLSRTWLDFQARQPAGAAPATDGDLDPSVDPEARRRWMRIQLAELTR